MAFDFSIDIFQALEKWKEFGQLKQWLAFLISLFCSFWLSGSFATGSALVLHRPPWEALGEGLISATCMATLCWRRSPLTKGMILALPEKEAEKEMESNTQVISG